MTTTVGAGIGSSLGSAVETTWGTWLTPTKWPEYGKCGVEFKPHRMQGELLAAGLAVQRDTWRVQTTSTVDGPFEMPLFYKGAGQWLGLIMGSLGVAPVQQGGTTAYLQTHTLAINNIGQSLSLQIGIPQLSGVIKQRNWRGVKATKAVFECAQDAYLTGSWDLDGQGEDTTNTYGAAGFAAGNNVYAFNLATFKFGALGSEAVVEGVRKLTLTVERPLEVANFYQDGTGVKQEQTPTGYVAITVAIESDYISDPAFVAQFVADTPQSLIWDFPTGVAAGTGFNYDIKFLVPNLRWEKGAPTVEGPKIVQPKIELKALYNTATTAYPMSISYMSTDTTL
jgi:Phage tail tube protein